MEKNRTKKRKVATIEFPGGPVVKIQEHVFIYIYICVCVCVCMCMCVCVCVCVCVWASLMAQTVDSALKTYSFHLMLVYPEANLTN